MIFLKNPLFIYSYNQQTFVYLGTRYSNIGKSGLESIREKHILTVKNNYSAIKKCYCSTV